jgi:hypothetical protein
MSETENPMNFDNVGSSHQTQEHNIKNMSNEQAMVLKLSHPPTNVPELLGLPTNDARTQVLIQWRNNDVMQVPSFEISNGVTDDGDWRTITDYGYIIPTGARVPYIGVYYGKTGFYLQDVRNTKVQDNFNFDVWKDTVNLYRPIYKSTTVYSNVTAFNNTGSMNVQQFNPAILFAGTLSEFSWQHPKYFSIFIKDGIEAGRIKTTNASHVDFNPIAIEHYFRDAGTKLTGVDLDPSTTIQVVNLGRIGYESDAASIMPSPSQINTNSMRSYAGRFADGAFAVQRLNTVSPAWLTGTRTYEKEKNNGLYQCFIFTDSDGSAPSFAQLNEQLPGNTSKVLTDTLWSQDMTWSFVRAQGITPNGLVTTTPDASVSPFLIKTYYGFEAQPVWGGPWNGLARVSPKPSLTAMQALIDTFYGMPDGMPAKYNFLGTILPFLKDIIPAGVSWIKSIFSDPKPKPQKKAFNFAGWNFVPPLSQGVRAASRSEAPSRDGPITVVRPPTIRGGPSRIPVPIRRRTAAAPQQSRIPRPVRVVQVPDQPRRRNRKELPESSPVYSSRRHRR